VGSLISTLYTTLEPKKEKVKSLMVTVLREIVLNGRYHEIILRKSSRFRWANRHSRSCFGLEPNSSSSFIVGMNITDKNKVQPQWRWGSGGGRRGVGGRGSSTLAINERTNHKVK
jgi:hypothetical protein